MKREQAQYNNEEDWIAGARRGDAEAFRQLVSFYEPQLFTYLARMLGDPESARDLVQETFLAAYRALPRWEPSVGLRLNAKPTELSVEQRYLTQHPLAPWLYRIATNFALNHLKNSSKKTNNQETLFAQISPFLSEGGSRSQAQPISELNLEDRYATRELLREALSHLSREDATCLLLRFVGGERYTEIAARLNISKEAVRKRVGRGLITLRMIYQQLDMEEF